MAGLTTAALTITSFTGLKPGRMTSYMPVSTNHAKAPATKPDVRVNASLKQVGAAVVATTMTAMLASNALAFDVLMGADDGTPVFIPREFSVSAGELIVFKNNEGVHHNVVFDKDKIPAGVDSNVISMKERERLNMPGENYGVTLIKKGDYTFYCSTHKGDGMVGKVTVK